MVLTKKENSFRLEDGEFEFLGTRNDPYGFWTVKGKRGKTTIKIDGEFTAVDQAVLAVTKRLQEVLKAPGGNVS